MTPSVAVVILNWNGKRDTLECLDSVLRMDYPAFEVIVVDNGSVDDSVAAIKREFRQVTLLETGANLGYAGGNNVGMRYAIRNGADHVLLLNNDTVVDKALLAELTRAAAALGERAILAPRIYYHAEPDRLWYAGGVVRKTARTSHQGRGCLDSELSQRSLAETDYASGCAFFVGTPLLRRVGLFDERFFLMYEETDLCARARALGAKCYVVAGAKVWHKVSVSFGGAGSPVYMYFIARNRLLWAEKNLPLHRRLPVYAAAMHEVLCCLLPPRVHLGGTPADPLRRRIRLALPAYRAALVAKRDDAVRRAWVRGVQDYVFRRFGNPAANAGGKHDDRLGNRSARREVDP